MGDIDRQRVAAVKTLQELGLILEPRRLAKDAPGRIHCRGRRHARHVGAPGRRARGLPGGNRLKRRSWRPSPMCLEPTKVSGGR